MCFFLRGGSGRELVRLIGPHHKFEAPGGPWAVRSWHSQVSALVVGDKPVAEMRRGECQAGLRLAPGSLAITVTADAETGVPREVVVVSTLVSTSFRYREIFVEMQPDVIAIVGYGRRFEITLVRGGSDSVSFALPSDGPVQFSSLEQVRLHLASSLAASVRGTGGGGVER